MIGLLVSIAAIVILLGCMVCMVFAIWAQE